MPRTNTNIFKSKAFWATAITAMLVTGVAIAAVAGHSALSQYAGTYAGNQAPLTIRFNWPIHETTPPNPDGSRRSWLPLKVQQELADLALDKLTTNPTDGEALARTAAALRATGWFDQIQSVRRADGNAVEIIGHWRTPVAVVRVAGSIGQVDRLISANGELLPVDYPAGSTTMCYIVGVSQPAPENYGERWEGGDVEAALKLMAFLYNSTIFSQVAGVDVTEYAKGNERTGRRLIVMTDTGAKVVWGAAPDDWAPSEPSADQKLKWLTYLRNGPEYGRRIDAGRPMVDVTNPRGIMIDQAAAEAAAAEQAHREAPPDHTRTPLRSSDQTPTNPRRASRG